MNKKEKALNLLVRFMKEAQGNTTLGERADTADKYAEEIVKLFAIPVVVNSVCTNCGEPRPKHYQGEGSCESCAH